MKRLRLRIMSIGLCFCMLLPLTACRKSNKNPDTKDDASEFKFTAEYMILRGQFYEDSEETITAMQLVRDAIGAVYGELPTMGNDFRRAGDETVNEFEILVGETNRDQSQAAIKTLGVNDYIYEIESENVIVICGGSPEATLVAAKQFCLDVLGYNTDTKEVAASSPSVKAGTKFTFKGAYSFENASFNGVDVKDITIAFAKDMHLPFAREVARIFAKHTGIALPVVKYEDLTGEEKAVICVDATDRSGNKTMQAGHSGYLLTNSTENGLLTVGVAVSNDDFIDNALTALDKNLTLSDEQGALAITLAKDVIYGFDFEDEVPKWYLESETNQTLADGVIYTEQLYYDENDLPYKVYILTVDPAKASIYMGTPNDSYDYPLTDEGRQTVEQHMRAAVANGVNVIAGVNANFFGVNDKGEPHGLSIKEGVITVGNSNPYAPYFGYTKDGKAVIGSNSAIPTGAVYETAIAGSHYIVKDGLPYQIDLDSEFGYTAHPRTLAGIKEDGTMIFAVVDGRQPAISNGAPLANAASLMISLGAKDAINLDGGGSSSFIIRNGNTYSTKNSPSDGQLRLVPLSLLIVGK